MAKHSQDLIDLICISHSERIICCKFTLWQDLTIATSLVNTKLASQKVSSTLDAFRSLKIPDVYSIFFEACIELSWEVNVSLGEAVSMIRLFIREASATETHIIFEPFPSDLLGFVLWVVKTEQSF
jgi:hypothetical protein